MEMSVAELLLDDARGYWRDLSAEAYDEFWSEYQKDIQPDVKQLLRVYRRLLCAALLLNHQADKVAPLHGLDGGNKFMDLVAKADEEVGLKLHACRHFANDAKHEMKRIQEARTRPRDPEYDQEGQFKIFEIHMLALDGELYDMCRVAGDVWQFWISYFDGSAAVNYRQVLSQLKLGDNTSSPGSC